MTTDEQVIYFAFALVLFLAGHQVYFWCQRYPLLPPRVFRPAIDELIPYRPEWVWIYSVLYYAAIMAVFFTVDSEHEFLEIAVSYAVLLVTQIVFFVAFPVATPRDWRKRNLRRTLSEKLLALVQKADMRSNSFPSMHTSVATLTALHLYPLFGELVLVFPVLIGLSCLFTKQHYLMDIPAGASLGYAVFLLSRMGG
jgi:membrane-associated phospholipid phosphatase